MFHGVILQYEPRERLSFIQIVATLEELLLRPLDIATSTSSDIDSVPEASNAGITNGKRVFSVQIFG